jgi:membrane-bound ClpP family serine protease
MPLLNKLGKAITPLRVYGVIEVDGCEYEARSLHNTIIKPGAQIRVTGRERYAYLVETV